MLQTTETDILAPFEIWEVPLENGNSLKFHKPLTLCPNWIPKEFDSDDEIMYLECDYEKLAISAFGIDRDELQSCVYGDIAFAWRHYALKPDDELVLSAVEIKNNYLAICEEVSDARYF